MRRFVLALVLLVGGCATVDPTLTPVEQGRQLYDRYCAECHGPRGIGTQEGPSLLDPRYFADQTDDTAFLVSTTEGVEATDTRFDGMAPIPAVSHSEVARITLYIRELQRAETGPPAGG